MNARIFYCWAAALLWITNEYSIAQEFDADYARARQLRQLTENKVFRARVKPQWSTDNGRFWYRNNLPDNNHEFVLVDTAVGTRQPAFPHDQVADQLGRMLGKSILPSQLPVRQLEFVEGNSALILHGSAQSWRWDFQTRQLSQVPGQERPASTLLRINDPKPSVRTGPETTIMFINHLDEPVELFWIDAQGDRQSYGKLKPNEEREQHTYGGHVWLIAQGPDNIFGIFEAVDEPATLIIDRGSIQRASPPKDTLRRKMPPRRNGLSPNSKWQAFFKDNNLRVRNLDDGEEFSLSTDGTEDDGYSGAIYWSPDSGKIVVLRTQKGDDRKVYYVESSPSDQLQPRLHSYAYLKPGDIIPHPRPCLFDVDKRRSIPISDALFPNPWSISELEWQSDSQRFTFLYNQRGHQILRLIAVNANTGEPQTIIDESSPTFIDYAGKFYLRLLEQTDEVIWMSERDGWNHLYLYNRRTGQLKNQITRGSWVVRDVDRVDVEERLIWFRAGGIRPEQDPYYQHYCCVNFDGTNLRILTEGDGTHQVEFSPDRRFFIDTWSRVDLPPVSELRCSDNGQIVCELERADASALVKTGWRFPERFTAKGRDGKTDIYGVIYRPTHFDPQKKYPVIEDIYAGPQGAFVPKAFRTLHSPQQLAEVGFIVVQIDGMGTSYRSKSFHDVCWKNLGDAGFPDRILWLKAAAARFPGFNLDRVGVYGGSAGGQNALGALLAHGDFYHVAVADCGCHDNRMDKIWWNELWMGWPIGPHYAEQSNVTQAHRLQGKLMLVVGEKDENVDPASTFQVVNALIKADKDFDLLVMTGTGHGAAETPYGQRRRAAFFVRHLGIPISR